jgi:hypothetical protein
MEKFRLKLFFCELIQLMYMYPGDPGFGNPVSWLIEQMCVYQDKFLSRIVGDYSGGSHECRINNAGLKLHWRVDQAHERFTCHISGDQAKNYPQYVAAANQVIRKFGFNKEA